MILYVEDILKEVNILNWYKGEAEKRKSEVADIVQSGSEQQDALLYFLRAAVNDVLLFANSNRVVFACDYADDALTFSLSPLREEKRYILGILKEAIRLYLVYEVRRLWMMTMHPEWAEDSLRESLRYNIREAMNAVTSGERVRRRATDLAGI